MKKFLFFITSFFLLGLSAANAITITFNFEGVNLSDEPYTYVTVTNYNNDQVLDLTSNSIDFSFNLPVNLVVSLIDPDQYGLSLNIGLDMDYENFNHYKELGVIYPYGVHDSSWLLALSDYHLLDGFDFTFTVRKMAGSGSGNTGSGEDTPPVEGDTEKTITLNFTGEGIVEGLTIDYSNYNGDSVTYYPVENPFTFEYSPEYPSAFSLSAEGYDFIITLAEESAEYADNVFINGNEVILGIKADITFDVLVEEGTSNAIDGILKDKETEIYNMQGLRLNDANNLPKGLYIINGKKVLVK